MIYYYNNGGAWRAREKPQRQDGWVGIDEKVVVVGGGGEVCGSGLGWLGESARKIRQPRDL